MDHAASADGEYVFELDGCVAAADAWRVHDAVRALPAGTRVVVDLHRALRVDDAAVAVFARALNARSGATLHIRGLGAHQHRILQYLGVAMAAPLDGASPGPGGAGRRAGGT